MSEQSQARRHPDDTRCQNEVRPDDTLTTHDVRTKSEGSQTMSGHRYGQALLSTISEIALPPIPFSQHTPTCFADARERAPFFPFLPYLFSIQTRPNVTNLQRTHRPPNLYLQRTQRHLTTTAVSHSHL